MIVGTMAPVMGMHNLPSLEVVEINGCLIVPIPCPAGMLCTSDTVTVGTITKKAIGSTGIAITEGIGTQCRVGVEQVLERKQERGDRHYHHRHDRR